MQRPFVHPTAEALKLESVLTRSPTRCGLRSCADSKPAIAGSTARPPRRRTWRSRRSRITSRFCGEAGLIQSERRGTEVVNTSRVDEIEKQFPGVVSAILKAAKPLVCPETGRPV